MHLQVGGLLDGAKSLNVSSNGTVVESAEAAADDGANPLVEAGLGRMEKRNGTYFYLSPPPMPPPPSAPPSPAPNCTGNATAGGGGGNATGGNGTAGCAAAAGTAAAQREAEAAADFDAITAPVLPGASRPGWCTYTNLTRCEATQVKVTTPALSLSIALVDTSHFELGRYVRINAGHPTEEDARIVGFGRRLTAAEIDDLALASARDAAESAKETVAFGGKPIRSTAAGASALLLAADARAAREAPEWDVTFARMHGGASFLETAASATAAAAAALRPLFEREGSMLRGPAAAASGTAKRVAPRAPRLPADGGGALLDASGGVRPPEAPEDGGSQSSLLAMARAAAERVHGRSLMQIINLSQPLRFAHRRGESVRGRSPPRGTRPPPPASRLPHLRSSPPSPLALVAQVLMLPDSTHRIRAIPGLQHQLPARRYTQQGGLRSPPAPPPTAEAIARQAQQASMLDPGAHLAPPPSPPADVARAAAKQHEQQQGAHASAQADARRTYDDAAEEYTYGGDDEPKPAPGGGSVALFGNATNASGTAQQASTAGGSAVWRKFDDARSLGAPAIATATAAALCLCVCVVAWVRSSSQRARRRRDLEDVESVFQTEVWRKLE